jgi:hypothetical protein
MPKVIHVKKARKANKAQGIKKGQSYYWWSVMIGGRGVKRYSLTKPKPSQLTNSEFWGTYYAIQEDVNDAAPQSTEDVETRRDDIVSQLESLRDETDEKFNNMPDGLQQGDTGQMLEERVSGLEEVISELENVDCAFSDDDLEEGLTDEEKRQEWIAEKWSEVISALDTLSCS